MTLNQRIVTSALVLSVALIPVASFAHDTGEAHTVHASSSVEIKAKVDLRKNLLEEKKAKLASTTAAKKAEFQEKKAQKASSTEAKREEKKDKRDDERKERVEKYLGNVYNRLTEAYNRIDRHIVRVQEFVTKHSAKLSNKAAIDAKLIEAKAAVTAGRANLATLKVKAEAEIASSTPKGILGDTKDSFKSAVAGVKTAHGKVIEAIRLIKANKGVNTSATTTVSTTATTTTH